MLLTLWLTGAAPYVQLGGGKACPAGTYVSSVSECAIAALSLDLSDTTVYNGGVKNGANPYGCYMTASGSLNFNTDETHKGSDFVNTRTPLCKKGALIM